MALVTLEEGKRHLRIDEETESPPGPVDQNVQDKIDAASDIVLDYLKVLDESPEPYTIDNVEPRMRMAVLLVVGNLYDDPTADPLSDGVKSILHRYRDPALA